MGQGGLIYRERIKISLNIELGYATGKGIGVVGK